MTADALKQKILLSSAAVFSNLFQFADPLIQRTFQNSNFYVIFMKHRIVEPVGGGGKGGMVRGTRVEKHCPTAMQR